MKNVILVLATVIVILLSCRKENVEDELLNAEINDPETFEALFQVTNQINRLYFEPDFRKFVYAEIDKKFDGDFNVLTKTIEENYCAKSKKEYSKESFSTINNKKYPQIFIPYYEELYKKGKIGIQDPVIVIYVDENENDKYEGFLLKRNGQIQKLNFLISEEYARNNEVWVISVNERVGENGKLKSDCTYIDPDFVAGIILFHSTKIKPNIYSNNTKSFTDCTPPGIPGNTEALPLVPYSIRVKWQDIQGIAYYKVFRETNYSGVYNEVAIVYPNQGATFLDTEKTVGVHYDYQIQAFNTSDCFSARSFGTGTWASWRTNNYNEILNQIYISDRCWNWCCGWPEGDIELMYRLVKYNKSDQQVEYPKNALPSKSKKSQKGEWCTYDKELFR